MRPCDLGSHRLQRRIVEGGNIKIIDRTNLFDIIIYTHFIKSSVIAILSNIFLIFVVCPILSAREQIIFQIVKSDAVQFVLNFLYYVLPKPGEIKDLTVSLFTSANIPFGKTMLIENSMGDFTGSWMSLITSLLFCLVLMSYSFYYFSKKDY